MAKGGNTWPGFDFRPSLGRVWLHSAGIWPELYEIMTDADQVWAGLSAILGRERSCLQLRPKSGRLGRLNPPKFDRLQAKLGRRVKFGPHRPRFGRMCPKFGRVKTRCGASFARSATEFVRLPRAETTRSRSASSSRSAFPLPSMRPTRARS